VIDHHALSPQQQVKPAVSETRSGLSELAHALGKG
jgi:hypothetical protein